MNRFIALVALLLAAFSLAPRAAHAEPGDIEAAARGVVRVIIIGRDGPEIFPISHGTGFAVGGERIVTNAHVVAEAVEDDRLAIGVVPPEGEEAVYARLVAVSPRNDLALLELTSPLGLPPLTIAGNPATDAGSVIAIGYPMNVDRAQGLGSGDLFRATPPVTATGFLSGRRPSRDFDTLLHTAPIARGNSGGPLVDSCGRVLGVNSFGTESAGSDAEFFFAVSTRELLPFLRANNVSPRINALPCRSIAELDAEQQERERAARETSQADAERAAEALEQRTADLRRTIGYEVIDSRANRQALAFLALLIAALAGSVAVVAHRTRDFRLRAIGGAVALLALIGGLTAWLTRPPFAVIETRVEDALRAEMEAESSGTIDTARVATSAGSYQCVLDTQRSRVVGAPQQDIAIGWDEAGCVNARTQYGLDGGEWTRIFVPAAEAAVSVNSFDPAAGEFVMERYLLDRAQMLDARAARAAYQAPQCGGGEDSARALGASQGAVATALPDTPNERLVYTCTLAPQPAQEPAPAQE